MYIASVDLVMEFGAYAFSHHNEGIFLYSTTTQLTIDYLSKAFKDGVVDSPPTHAIVPIVVN